MGTNVDVKNRGVHAADNATLRVFRDAAEIVRACLLRAGCDGDYEIVPREKTRWKPKTGTKICLRPSGGKDVRLRVKPGDNGTSWEYSLIGTRVNMDFVRENLEKVLGPEETNGDHEIVSAPEAPLDGPSSDPDDALEKLSQLVSAVQKRKERQKEMDQLRQQIVELDKKIQSIQDSRAEVELELEELVKQDASDKQSKIADQIALLMSSI